MSGLVKPKKINIADTNLANFGTDLEKKVKEESAKGEAAWTNAGKQVGVQVWRIEKFKVVAWPKDQYGNFYDGDSYIILNTYKEAGQEKLKFNLHFWLGETTSQDEAGTAAYKTVELDTLLGGDPVQYREVHGFESAEFLGLFKGPIRIMAGGEESGFRHVGPTKYVPRLLHVKGKKRPRAMESTLSHESLNSGDCFVLDAGLNIWVWQGKDAGIFEKNKAGEVARAIDDERGAKPKTVTVSEGDKNLGEFWKILGASEGGPAKIKGAKEAGPDEGENLASLVGGTKKLFRISDASGKLSFQKEAEGKITKAMFESKDAFVFDLGGMIFVWIGKDASKHERALGLQIAANYLKEQGRPVATPIARVVEGGENAQFKAFLDA